MLDMFEIGGVGLLDLRHGGFWMIYTTGRNAGRGGNVVDGDVMGGRGKMRDILRASYLVSPFACVRCRLASICRDLYSGELSASVSWFL
jgi:hypothetical protein